MTEWIDDPDALARAVRRLSLAPRLAVDCESNAMHAHRARVCIVQLAAAREDGPSDDVVLVDTLALGVGGPLAALLSADGPTKVFHDLGYDARILAAEGVTLGNAVDTSVHARLLGTPETGLASLLAKRFGLALDKRFQHHDWAERPVRDDARRYLEGDVSHLGALYAQLAREVAAAGIEDEVRCETDYGLRRALEDAAEGERARRPPFARIKGYRELRGAARAVAREVAAAREALAAERDVPIGRILPNALVLAVARARPRNRTELVAAIGPMHANAPWSGRWLDASLRGLAARELSEEDLAWFANEPLPSDLAARRARAERLSAWRRAEASRRGVDLQVVLPGHCVEDLASRPPASIEDFAKVPGFGASRTARYGEALLPLLSGTPPARE